MFDIEEELKKLPAKPGVYIMHDKKDTIIYVGKAVSLKNRVRQYFQPSKSVTPKIARMIEQIDHFEYIITDSELEALVLECNLIKEHRPKYNTMLMDDKGYPFIKATVGEPYPRLLFARQPKRDKAKYFGPYTSAGAVKDTLLLMQKIYHIRTCHRNLPRDIGKERPCLNYHIKQCKAPCQGYISQEEYQQSFREALEFLNGNYAQVLKMLEEKMQKAAECYAFEEAAEYRDLLTSVKHIAQKQKITSQDMDDKDIIAVAKAANEAVVQVFFIRGGKLIGRDHFHFNEVEHDAKRDILTAFIKQFYAGTPYIPKVLLVQEAIQEEAVICEWLTAKKGQKVYIQVTQKGEKERLIELAEKNASMVLQQDAEKLKQEEKRTIGAVHELEGLLNLSGIRRMESFDISNINGFESVGSMVVFERGKAKKNDYRKFKIKWIQGADDYGSMREILTRRFAHGLKEREELREKNMDLTMGSFSLFPDLILMDGGKGQVNVALQVLEELRLNIPVCGMVKDDNHRTRGLYYNNQEIPMDSHSESFRLVTRIQDETHRFAIEYHRSLRGKTQVHSILDEIDGIGATRRKALIKHFKSLEALKEASAEEIALAPSMNAKAAQSVYDFFHNDKS